MATQARLSHGTYDTGIHVNGAPEAVFDLCACQANNGGGAPLGRAYWKAESVRIAVLSQQIIAIATEPAATVATRLDLSDLAEGRVLLGLVGLIDPLRARVIA